MKTDLISLRLGNMVVLKLSAFYQGRDLTQRGRRVCRVRRVIIYNGSQIFTDYHRLEITAHGSGRLNGFLVMWYSYNGL